jgi:crotonobetainyl-CoA:carnitine CoA-transferase CaiB-like acyl-CoA transferase
MTDVMQGVRILEVAEHTFVPAASALLADWGAEVIKVEHVERGDAMRGLLKSSGLSFMQSNVHVLLEHSNRGKQSIGLDLGSAEGLDVLYKLVATCDVFLTNKMPGVRTKLKIDVDDLRAHNPNIIYVRGTGQGERGPDADKGSYDSLAYWNRSGIALGLKAPDAAHAPSPPPAFGDSIGAMTIAGGIMGALFHRERTGEATTVDVSLLATGMWSMGAGLALSLQLGIPWGGMGGGSGAPGNPLMGNFEMQDGKQIALCCLQPMKYWPAACELIGRPELATDERFATLEGMGANSAEGVEILKAAFAERSSDEWRPLLAQFPGQWTFVQNTLEAAEDPQSIANGYVSTCLTAEGEEFKLATAPIQFGGVPAQPGRSPEFNEQGDAILESLGLDWDTILDLKVKGVVA